MRIQPRVNLLSLPQARLCCKADLERHGTYAADLAGRLRRGVIVRVTRTRAGRWSLEAIVENWQKSGKLAPGSDTPNANFTVNIRVMNADGSARHPVTKATATNADCDGPNWHP